MELSHRCPSDTHLPPSLQRLGFSFSRAPPSGARAGDITARGIVGRARRRRRHFRRWGGRCGAVGC
jgi:hypothetical protein